MLQNSVAEDREEITAAEKDIRAYIEQNLPEDYDSILMKDNRWEVFYHLTAMRNSILNWYDFKPNARILQIGGELGSLTGMLCEKCEHVTVWEKSKFRAETISIRCRNHENLEVYSGLTERSDFHQKFDYIVMIGTLEAVGKGSDDKGLYERFLKKCQQFLKKEGKFLIAVENRYGLKYFCGDPEPHTGVPYSGINKYPFGTSGYSFSRQEILDIAQRAGMKDIYFYYPLPDYRLTQLVYSEKYLPGPNLKERLFFYHTKPGCLTALENRLYDDIIENGVFEFFANSFLLECGMETHTGERAVYAAVTTDRGAEDALATVTYDNRTVRKKPLFAQGKKRLEEVYRNINEIHVRGIKTVPHSLDGENLLMPYVSAEMFSDYLRRIGRERPSEFEERIEQLYQAILDSSEHVDPELNEFPCEGKDIDCGVILKKAYIDMVPLNCFFSEGELIFFDQEFTRKNYPALYTLFRALKYTYLFTPEIDKFVPLDYLKDKYHMKEIWELCVEEENRFVASNRKYDVYDNFYKWVWFDEMKVYKNGISLLSI